MRSIQFTKMLVISALFASALSACSDDDDQRSLDLETSPSSSAELGAQSSEIRYGAADGAQHPSVVQLLMQVGNAYYLCSGSVIAEDAVLTAAHCVDQISHPSDVMIMYGG